MNRVPHLVLLAAAVAACESSKKELLRPPEEQSALRAMQSRAFDTTDEQKTMRAVIATLQDLGFVIDDANSPLGIVSATKLDGGVVRVMVTVKQHGTKQVSVRASVQSGTKTVTDPATYQEFFVALSKGMFLTAHEIE
jgi:hypothetical protein